MRRNGVPARKGIDTITNNILRFKSFFNVEMEFQPERALILSFTFVSLRFSAGVEMEFQPERALIRNLNEF